MAHAFEPMTVLLVDPIDELGPLSRALSETDETITVETVSSVDELDTTTIEPDCLVVIDYRTRGVDGIDLMHAVHEELPSVPVVIHSIDPTAYYVTNALAAGATDVICTGPENRIDTDRPVVTVRRIRHAAGKGESFQTDTELLDSVMQHLPHQVFIKDDVGRIAAISDVSVREHKPDREQLIGMTDYDLFDPETARALREQEDEIMATEEPMINNVEQFVDDEGRERWVNTTKAPRYGPNGEEVVGIIGTARDITEQKRNEEMMNALHVASRELVSATTENGVATTAVEIARDIPDLPVLDVLFADSTDGSLRIAATSRADDTPSIYDRYTQWFDRAYDTDELQFIVQLSGGSASSVVGYAESEAARGVDPIAVTLPLGNHGVLGFGSTNDTLSEFSIDLMEVLAANAEAALDRIAREDAIRRRERELARQNERLQEFASIVSHDLRNPLSVAQGYAEMFDTTDESAEQVQWALGRMEQLTDELLTLARQGQIIGNTEQVSLRAVIEDAWQSVDTDGAVLDVRESVSFESDPARTAELFENLIRNAIEHNSTTSDSSVRISVGVLEDGFYLEDDGVGIPDENKPSVFDQGFSDGGGTGLGLYIVETLAEAHGWTVEVTDAKHAETGARFEFVGITDD